LAIVEASGNREKEKIETGDKKREAYGLFSPYRLSP
jgi:hypothetical protein